jgi:hypothetical protein
MKVDHQDYWTESMKVARVEGVIEAYRIIADIDRRHGVDTTVVDRLLNTLERELEDG